MRRAPVLQILLFLPLLGATAQHRVLRYEPAKVELKGRLTIEQRYGPPNYGENPDTDQKVQIPVLLLSEPVDVQGDPQSDLDRETVRGVQRVQLVFRNTSYRRLVGKNITVKGTFFRALTGHHYTDVVMDVLNVRESPGSNYLSPRKANFVPRNELSAFFIRPPNLALLLTWICLMAGFLFC